MSEIFKNNTTSFFWWASEDDAIWLEWTYNYWENIEVKRFSKFVELAKAPINSFSHIQTLSTMNLWMEAPNPLWIDWIFFLWDDGVIMRSDWVQLYEESGTRDLKYHGFNVWDAFYFTASWWVSNPMRLNKILHSDIDSDWTWNISEDILNWDTLELIEAWFTEYHRFLVVWNIVYISSWGKIAKYNHNTWLVEAQFDFFPSDIVWMTYWPWNIKIFLKSWLMYLWDWVNEQQPLDIIDLWEKLENAKSIWAIEYVIWWDLWWLAKFFVLDWRRLKEINSKQYSRLLWIDKFNVTTTWNFQNISNANNQIFLLDYLDEWAWEIRLSSYWNKINWLPKWYSVDLTRNSNWNTMWKLSFIFVTQWKLFFWYSNSSTDRWVDYINLTQNNWPFISEWLIIDKLFDWWDIIEVKKEEKIIWKCIIEEWTSIDIYQSKNEWNFELIKTVDENTVLTNWWFTLSQTSFKAGSEYRENSYKAVLKTTNPSKSPRWYWFKRKYTFT